MRLHIVAAVLLISASNTLGLMTCAAGQNSGVDSSRRATPDSLRDRYRPLLVFAPTDTDPRFLEQARSFGSKVSEMRERQVILIPIAMRNEAATRAGWNGADEAELSKIEATEARRRFHIAPAEFAVILIGKDGGEKYRAHTPVTIERLNAVIDAMPMRQQEVRNGDSK